MSQIPAANLPANPADKPVTIGRDNSPGSDGARGGGQAVSSHCSAPKAGVVIRAYVEHVGLAGETELTVNVKWPASTFCVQPCEKPAAPSGNAALSEHVPGNGPEASNF